MDDLTQCLYEFLLERRMGELWKDSEYITYNSGVELLEKQIKSHLNAEQWKELELLLDRISERDSFEKTRLFQAALGLVRELNAIVSA